MELLLLGHQISLCQQTLRLFMVVSRLSGGSPDGTLQEVVVIELLGGHQVHQRRLPTAQALDLPEVTEALQPWCQDD